MNNNKNPVIRATLWLSIGMVICLAVMLGVYWLIGKLELLILISGAVGTAVAIGNFFFMAVGLSSIPEGTDAMQIKLRAQGSFMIRALAVLAILVVAIKVFKCDAIATLIPLLFTRPIFMVEQFILKAKEEKHANSN